jgi:hypothetical protein
LKQSSSASPVKSPTELSALGAHDGNMMPPTSLRFICQACGLRNCRATIFVSQHEVDAFL